MCLAERGCVALEALVRPGNVGEKGAEVETADKHRRAYNRVLRELESQFEVINRGYERYPSAPATSPRRQPFADAPQANDATPTAESERETVFLFDWDDTIMPTSFLGAEESRKGFTALSSYARFTFIELDRLVLAVLRKSHGAGKLVIVTNAGEGWVQASAARYMPNVSEFLREEGIRIVSARSNYFAKFPEAPLEWKVNAFADELREVRHKLNLVVLGDSLSDQYAAHVVSDRLNGAAKGAALLKFVKLIERPSLEQVKKQMSLVLLNMERLVSYSSAFDICVAT